MEKGPYVTVFGTRRELLPFMLLSLAFNVSGFSIGNSISHVEVPPFELTEMLVILAFLISVFRIVFSLQLKFGALEVGNAA
jgi:hypothetical protein